MRRLETPRTHVSLWLGVLLALGRSVVFVVGGIAGYLVAGVTGAFLITDNPFLWYSAVLTPLALALAAPVCWYFTFRGKAGDRWMLGYVLAWVAFISANYLAVLINNLT